MIEKEKRKYLFEVKKKHDVNKRDVESGNKDDSFLTGLMNFMCFPGGDAAELREDPGTQNASGVRGNVASREESTLERTLDCIAFPEDHIKCGSELEVGSDIDSKGSMTPMEQSRSLVQRRQSSMHEKSQKGSSFESFMDTVAFPEKHINCSVPSEYAPSMPTDALMNESFENVMNVVAFPERHVSCGVPTNEVSSRSNGESTFEKFMNVVAFPEKHISCPNPNESTKQNQVNSGKRGRWQYGGKRQQANKNQAVQGSSHGYPTVHSDVEDRHPNGDYHTFIQRDDHILSGRSAPLDGDMLVVKKNYSNRKEQELVEKKRRARAILYNRDGSDTLDYFFGSVESFTCRDESRDASFPDEIAFSSSSRDVSKRHIDSEALPLRRDRSLISEFSMSTVSVQPEQKPVSTVSVQPEQKPVQPEKKQQRKRSSRRRGGEGMEIILGSQQQSTSRSSKKPLSASGKKKNLVNQFVARGNKKNGLSLQSRRALRVGEP